MIRIAGIVKNSITDGPGFRYTIFTQGCPHNCFGCHNPDSHSFIEGEDMSPDNIINEIMADPLLDGVTFSGGEPFMQAEEMSQIATEIRNRTKLNIICFTGYTWEEIIEQSETRIGWKDLLESIDVLIDGRFEITQRSMNLRFRGSSNQRAIDVKKSLESNSLVIIEI